jgi:hypothetical protein
LIRRYLRLLQTARAYDKKSVNSALPSDYSFQPTLNRKSLLIESVQEKEKEENPDGKTKKRGDRGDRR